MLIGAGTPTQLRRTSRDQTERRNMMCPARHPEMEAEEQWGEATGPPPPHVSRNMNVYCQKGAAGCQRASVTPSVLSTPMDTAEPAFLLKPSC
ncbi:hypothetical protein UPYG_G00298050 [Umbra pygmaea]|uniref:Uncharacterized protein n=1 Tax=Umbra pygmaea TaxID=75934 RepID=A0ABD0WAM9_UMBPY